jgi:DNA-binding NarL/FixJ family response regulator
MADLVNGTPDAVRVVLVDDHDLFRTGLRNLLEEQQGVQVLGEAADGLEAVRLVREAAPDVVVMDLNMPKMSGVEATKHITAQSPLTRVIVLTISDQDADVMDAIVAGACGYLLKDASIESVVSGIRSAAVGASLISPSIASKVLQRVRSTTADTEMANAIRAELSDRELEVLKLIANGKDNAQIAAELVISPKTVKNHISNILMKLQIQNRIQAAVYAVRSGLAEAEGVLGDPQAAQPGGELGERRTKLRDLSVGTCDPLCQRGDLDHLVPAGLLEAPGALLETAPQPEALALGAQNPRVAVREHALGVLDRRRRRVAQPPDVVQHGR